MSRKYQNLEINNLEEQIVKSAELIISSLIFCMKNNESIWNKKVKSNSKFRVQVKHSLLMSDGNEVLEKPLPWMVSASSKIDPKNQKYRILTLYTLHKQCNYMCKPWRQNFQKKKSAGQYAVSQRGSSDVLETTTLQVPERPKPNHW
jgi:hypothetical protein